MDTVSESAILAEEIGASYKLLSDPEGTVVKEYGIYDLLDDGVAAPSVFVVGSSRFIEWSYIGNSITDRPSVNAVLSHVE